MMSNNTVPVIAWHAATDKETLERLQTDPQAGLDSAAVLKRQQDWGLNVITPKKTTPLWMRFLMQFNQPLVYILLIAAGITGFLHEWVDASVIFGVVLINAIVGFLQEAKALKALDALSRSMVTPVVVLRGGRKERIPSEQLVPGDIVLLVSGDKVAADMRLLFAKDLKINESALTGESVAVDKISAPVEADAVLADRSNMAYASTLVTYGQGKAVVVATGDMTEIGKISELISNAENIETPLTQKIGQFSHYLLIVILAFSALTFMVGMFQGRSAVEMFMISVSLAVAAIPEGLPAAVTIVLAIGVARMAKRRAIIRKLPAVETLGSTQIICSDKTGTLTENKMTVQEVFAGGEVYALTGTGYTTEGLFTTKADARPVSRLDSHALREILTAGLLCNDSRLVNKDGFAQIEGDPTEGALIVSAEKAEKHFKDTLSRLSRIDAIPFESEYQYMATLHDIGNGKQVIYLKGAVEQIITRCVDELDASGQRKAIDRDRLVRKVEEAASRGLRVLGFARLEMAQAKTAIRHQDVAGGLTFLGLQAMIDPPREEAIRAVQACHTAGIRIKMITGDHVLTATAIAGQLGIKAYLDRPQQAIRAITGKELEAVGDDQLPDVVDQTSVFARVTPEQKLKLVKALQSRGFIVAMTGDGVNDAPALKQANIGVAMGQNGTEIAKEAADMILVDDNFASIEAAVEEGRGVFDNLRKFIIWTIPTNLGESLAVVVAIFAGLALPIMPVQLLWVNMTTATCLGMMLAFEVGEKDVMRRPPRDPGMPILTKWLVFRTAWVGTFLAAGLFWLFFYEQGLGASLPEARTAAVSVLVFGETFYLLNCRSLTRSMFSLGLFSNRWLFVGVSLMVILQVLFIYNPVMNKAFHTAPIAPGAWLRILSICAVLYALVEIEKWLSARLRRVEE